jgi:hypothetical protein
MTKKQLHEAILRLLKVIDIYVALQSNAANTYRLMAHRAEMDSSRALLAWLYNIETGRLLKLASRRRLILGRHPELIRSGTYEPKSDSPFTKMGSDSRKLAFKGPLDILRYAIENETRALHYFRRKGISVDDHSMKLLYSSVVKEHQDQIKYLTSQRKSIMQEQVNRSVDRFAEGLA